MNLTIATPASCACFFTVSNGFRLNPKAIIITMRDRSKNRKPLQKGRNLSIEAIQAVQSLKRANRNGSFSELERVFDSKFRRLLKFDMMAVLRELLRQNECLLALKVFDDIRKESWYKPRLLIYADMLSRFASNGLFKEDRSSFRILINGLESIGETGYSSILRQDAQKIYGESLDFLEEEEEVPVVISRRY